MTTDVATVSEDENLADVCGSTPMMRFRHLPVTDGDRLIGLFTERDMALLSASTLPSQARNPERAPLERYRVRDVMVRKVFAVSPHTRLDDAGRLMLIQRIGCLPVVDENDCLKGIITSSDFVRLIVEQSCKS